MDALVSLIVLIVVVGMMLGLIDIPGPRRTRTPVLTRPTPPVSRLTGVISRIVTRPVF